MKINGFEVEVGQLWSTNDGELVLIAMLDEGLGDEGAKHSTVRSHEGYVYGTTGVRLNFVGNPSGSGAVRLKRPLSNSGAEIDYKVGDRLLQHCAKELLQRGGKTIHVRFSNGKQHDRVFRCVQAEGSMVRFTPDEFQPKANERVAVGDIVVLKRDGKLVRATVPHGGHSDEEFQGVCADGSTVRFSSDGIERKIEAGESIDPQVKRPCEAPEFLEVAAKHMSNRAATYDKPEGERSMGKTVEAFNVITGHSLTEAQGWLLQQILKDVRLFQRAGFHQDSAEDCVAYAALKAEAKAKEVSA